jgi:hypothetical protein
LYVNALGAVEQAPQVKAGQGIVGVHPDQRGEGRHGGGIAGLHLGKRLGKFSAALATLALTQIRVPRRLFAASSRAAMLIESPYAV